MSKQPEALPEGWKLIAVNAEAFSELMYWLDRCESKGHLLNCSDLIEPWKAFDYSEVDAAELRCLHSLNAELVDALKLLDEAFCADDYGTREGRDKGRKALVAARAAVAKAEAQQ